MAALPSAPRRGAAASSTTQLRVLPRPRPVLGKNSMSYVTKDRLVMCVHKRAKLRSCRQLCNDFWLLNFSSAPTLLSIERPYSPSQPALFCFLIFLFLTHPCPFTESCFCLSLFLSLAPVLILSVHMALTLCSYFSLLFEQTVHCLRLLSPDKYNSPLSTPSSCLTLRSLKL